MKALAKTIGGILFAVFCLVVFFWTASLSLAELRIILPGDPIMPYVGLVLTDFGALTWLLVFIGRAKGLMQRSIAIIMLVIDLTGVILLSAGRLLTAGQTLAEVPKELGPTLIWGIIGLTLINLIAAYVFHISEPDVMKEINFGVLTDRLHKEALDQAERNIEAEAQALGAVLAARATADLKYSLRLPYNDIEAARRLEDSQMNKPAAGQVIDAKATDPGKSPSLFEKIFKKDKPPSPITQPAPAMVTNEQTVTDQVKLQPKQEDAGANDASFPTGD